MRGTCFYPLVAALLLATPLTSALSATAGEEAKPCVEAAAMNNARLESLIRRIGDDVEGRPGFWQFSVANRGIIVITDETADRMRIISGITETDNIEDAQLARMMLANFDSALDARYAVAKGVLWSAYLHPLSTLKADDFVSGLAQVVNLAATYGSTYSSGALTFGGGDSSELINKLRERANSI